MSCGVVMLLDQLTLIHRDELALLDDELSTDNGVVHADGLAEDDR